MVATDQLPEYEHYRDDGCDIAPSCLACPLPACRYDLPPMRAGALMREAQLRELMATGLTADQCAETMGISRRTVFRLKRYAVTAGEGALVVIQALGADLKMPDVQSPAAEWPLSSIRANPLNPRGAVAQDAALRELADSIRAQGVLQPLLLTPDGTLIAGHRRLAAARLAGLTAVPVYVRDLGPAQQLAAMVVENLHRVDLTPMQVARAYQALADAGNTQAAIARMVGKSQPVVGQWLRLTALPLDIQADIDSGDLMPSQGIALTRFVDRPEVLQAIARDARRRGMSVEMIASLDDEGQKPKAREREPGIHRDSPTVIAADLVGESGSADDVRLAERSRMAELIRERAGREPTRDGRTALYAAAVAIDEVRA